MEEPIYRFVEPGCFTYHRNMVAEPDITNIAALLAEPSRATMLVALLGKDALPATELAHKAYISPQTASSHLSKLVAGNLIAVERHGRHRYYRLASVEVGRFIETLATIAPPPRVLPVNDLDEHSKAIRYARTCYDHLAGKVGVEIARSLELRALLTRSGKNYEVTAEGEKWFKKLRIDAVELQQERRPFALQCLDWSERQHHIAGLLGAALLDRLFALNYIARMKNPRCIRITLEGKKALGRLLNLHL
jgi:DNA-binding transcriptional ArsR family regulator